jgi:hypothetical protein
MIFGTPPIVTQGLVLHLDAGSRQSYVSGSTTWSDLSGNSNNGTLTSGPTYNNTNQGNLNFAGGSYVAGSTTNLPSGNSSFTKSVWINSQYKGTFDNHPNIISWGINSANQKNGLSLQTDQAGTTSQILHWFFANDYTCSIRDITNTWANITVTYSSPTLIFYLNGITQLIQPVTGTPNVTATVAEIGKFGASAAYYYSGSIGSISIYNRALSAQEIAQNYNALKNRFGLI